MMIELSRNELARYDGETIFRKYIAFEGIIYDVTGCPKWKSGMHENLHFPGQDLTSELTEAPHGQEVFEYPGVIRVGKLIE